MKRVEIKESDINILDKFLDTLCLNKNVDVDFLCSSGIVLYDPRNPSKASKEAKDILDKYNLHISSYCGEVKRIGFGSFYYIKDERTLNFKEDGGFEGLYKRQLEVQERIKQEETNRIQEIESNRWWDLKLKAIDLVIALVMFALGYIVGKHL